MSTYSPSIRPANCATLTTRSGVFMANSITIDIGIPGVPATGTPASARPSRYRRPGDLLHLLASGLALMIAAIAAAFVNHDLLGRGAWIATGVEPQTTVGELLTGI